MEGRDTAIPKLLEQHGGRLYGLGLKLCGGPEEAEDLVQETFLQAYRKWDQFEGRSKPSTWLYTIASRVCQRMHRLRAGQPEKIGSLEDLVPFGDREMAVPPEGPLDAQIRKEGRARIEQAIASLPIDFRMPLVLKDIVGFPVAEVAAILGLKEATVKTRVHRARLRLRQELTAEFETRALPPPAYPKQVCLDLLAAKQEALDRGVEFPREVICDRCRAVFASLDLAGDICAALGQGELPAELKKRLIERLSA
ncbi:MAG: RNA polymerase sigma factor [Planctomycetota bacterium]|nr:RNA polymerase sigma factor [Planctomycetota bacterium]